MNREQMLLQLQAMDLYTLDLNLYLNTHPDDRQAQSKFNSVAKEANELRQQYENMYGPLCMRRPNDAHPWQWIENPWPWNSKYSNRLTGGDK